jgi:hypothetical protein
MIIAMTISAIVIMGTYSLFNTIFKAQTSTSENLYYTGIYNSLSKIINDDFINMTELSEEQKTFIDNESILNKKSINETIKPNEANPSEKVDGQNGMEQSSPDNYSDNKTDNETQQNYFIMNKLNNFPILTFSTYNSLFFNKSIPVIVSYFIDEDDYLVRSEKNQDLTFKKEIKLIGDVENFEITSFNGEDFIDELANPRLMRLTFIINGRTYQISSGKFIKNEKQ